MCVYIYSTLNYSFLTSSTYLISMDRVMRVFSLVSFLCICVVSITVSFCNGNLIVRCKESERQTLLMFKKDLNDSSSNLLSSWVGEGDCCNWTGVACDNLSGHVHELHLAGYRDQVTSEWHGLGGKVNPFLLNLTHLSYLDLSWNSFEGQQVPSFLGSLKGLRYLNLSYAGFEGAIPRQLGNLSSLRYLDLSSNLDLRVENLEWLSGLSLLKHLDMSYVDLKNASHWLQVTNTLPSLLVELHLFGCQLYHIPSGISNLTSLKVLDLDMNNFNCTMPKWLYSLSHLESLDLSGNAFHGEISSSLGNLTTLVELHLSGCGLYHIPSGIANLTNLKVLDLEDNHFNSTMPKWLYSLSHLESLNLYGNTFHGEISSALGNLTALVDLQLSHNQLEGKIPNSLGNLCKLTYVGLSYNNFRGRVSEIFESLSRCSSGQNNNLESLDLSLNAFHGEISSYLGNLTTLVDLQLSENQLEGEIPNSLGNLCNLRTLDLSSNSISGPIPVSLGNLSRLEELDIHNNSFKGVVSEVHFTNLTRLDAFSAHENSLTLKTSPDWIPAFQLSRLSLDSWRLDPSELPAWLKSQKHLSALEMYNTGISGTIPTWFWNIFGNPLDSYNRVDLSCNQLSGEVPNIVSANWPKQKHFDSFILGTEIDLKSNRFNGSLPLVSWVVSKLDLSNSSFSGTLSHFFCDVPKHLQFLHLDNNLLVGDIPDCLVHWPDLIVVNLEDNNLTGKIPSSVGDLLFLQSLHLRNNNLSGELPVSLQKCEELVLLDVGENKFVGSIPVWIGKRLPNLVVLSLRSNKLHGAIPDELCSLKYLRILDLAHNNLSGTIPRCFQNLTSMATTFSSEEDPSIILFYTGVLYIIENAIFVTKGREVKYDRVLGLVTSLDLSSNMISGEIPEELTSLICLHSLNLSDNRLTGRIPSKIGHMRQLESLDLSVNQLSGEISPSISNLTFLSYLNLSRNNLIGQIPISTQLQSFDPSSYGGNKLCGFPLEERCRTKEALPPVGDEKHGEGHFFEDGWFYLSLGLGFALGFWTVLGSLLSNVPWSNAFSRFQNRIVKKLYDAIVERY